MQVNNLTKKVEPFLHPLLAAHNCLLAQQVLSQGTLRDRLYRLRSGGEQAKKIVELLAASLLQRYLDRPCFWTGTRLCIQHKNGRKNVISCPSLLRAYLISRNIAR